MIYLLLIRSYNKNPHRIQKKAKGYSSKNDKAVHMRPGFTKNTDREYQISNAQFKLPPPFFPDQHLPKSFSVAKSPAAPTPATSHPPPRPRFSPKVAAFPGHYSPMPAS